MKVDDSFGRMVINKYGEAKDVVMKKGRNVDGKMTVNQFDNAYTKNGDHIVLGSVDNDEYTRDDITLFSEKNPYTNQPDVKRISLAESMTEAMKEGRLVITYNYLETLSMSGGMGQVEFSKDVDAKTGRTLK